MISAENTKARDRHGREVGGDAVNPRDRAPKPVTVSPNATDGSRQSGVANSTSTRPSDASRASTNRCGGDREHAEDSDVPAIGKDAIPDHEPDDANGDHREGDQDQPIGVELGPERHQELRAVVFKSAKMA